MAQGPAGTAYGQANSPPPLCFRRHPLPICSCSVLIQTLPLLASSRRMPPPPGEFFQSHPPLQVPPPGCVTPIEQSKEGDAREPSQPNARGGRASFLPSCLGARDCGDTGKVPISVVPSLVRTGPNSSSGTPGAEAPQPAPRNDSLASQSPPCGSAQASFLSAASLPDDQHLDCQPRDLPTWVGL